MTRRQNSGLSSALVVTRNLPPLLGGMERLNLQMIRELAGTHAVTVIGPTGCRDHLPADVEVIEVPARPLSGFLFRALAAAWRVSGHGFQVVIAGSGLAAPMARLAAWRSGGKAMAYVHGLDLVARHPIYRMVWIPLLRGLDHAWANSRSTADIAARLGVARRNITVLHPGVAMPVGEDPRAGAKFRERHGLHGARILLSVGRLTRRKGLPEFVRMALPEIHARHPAVVFLIIGEEAVDAVDERGEGIKAEIVRAAADAGLGRVVRFLPHCSDAQLAAAYRAADVHVFPVIASNDDIEGFGMVALEAAAHGLPTIAFATGGIPDAVADGVSGRLVAPGDYPGFADQVGRLLDGAAPGIGPSAMQFARGFDWSSFGDKLRRDVDRILDQGGRPPAGPEGHALLDLRSRALKARKIQAVLGLVPGSQRLRVLEIGTGSGGIANYFGTHGSLRCEVDAIDVQDVRQVIEGFRFQTVDGVGLPFDDGAFDVVISNHVIEHVGARKEQARHLAEMRRVLAPKGRGYLAVPNRWMLVEPHYRLAFLSWLPREMRSRYLLWRRGVPFYDCEPLEAATIESLFVEAGLRFERAVGQALKSTIELEGGGNAILNRMLMRVPDSVIDKFAAVIPTLVYRFERGDRERGGAR